MLVYMHDAKKYLDIRDTAELMGVSVSKIRRALKKGTISGVRLTGPRSKILISVESIEQLASRPPATRAADSESSEDPTDHTEPCDPGPSPEVSDPTAIDQPRPALSGPAPTWRKRLGGVGERGKDS